MDNAQIKLENILDQAPHWTFAGDCTLLQWMTQISQNLESRAIKTTETLNKLKYNIRTTNIALDNVANSLTALQFGNQFVECRVQDDDETLNSINGANIDDSANLVEHTPTSKEMLSIFLNNNLKVLRNCHEKYSIDLEDSEDDEIEGKPKEKTCIYQPINPYNQRPLPFIFGSKDWHVNWHVGLYENQHENSYSGDELSVFYSESSSASRLDDNESLESNTEWASSNSIDHENLKANIENINASSLRPSQQIYIEKPINAAKSDVTISESSTISTPSSSLAKKPIQTQTIKEHLLKRSESKNSLESTKPPKICTKLSSDYKENSLNFKTQPSSFVDLFTEPLKDVQSTVSSSTTSPQNVSTFPDEHQRAENNESKTSYVGGPITSVLTKQKSQVTPFVDLFGEPPSDIIPSTSLYSSGFNVRHKTVNLFEGDELDDVEQNDLLLASNKNEKLSKSINKEKEIIVSVNAFKISKTATKSLFEDSDDEDDFLREFVSKQAAKETLKSALSKTLLFDNNFNESSNSAEEIAQGKTEISNNNTFKKDKNKIKLFDNFEDTADDDLLFTKHVRSQPKNVTQNIRKENHTFENEENTNKSIGEKDLLLQTSQEKSNTSNLFNDTETSKNDLLFNKKIEKDSSKFMHIPINENDSEVIKTSCKEEEYLEKSCSFVDDLENNFRNDKKPSHKTTKLNIFSDLDTEDGDDLFSKKHKQTSSLSDSGITNAKILLEDNEKSLETIKPNLDIRSEETIGKDKENSESEVFETHPKEERKVAENETFFKSKQESLNVEFVITEHDNYNKSTIVQSKQVTDLSTRPKSSTSDSTYGFNSILFMDEPPEDDNDFFESLANTTQAHITNYNVIDLENDLYEPELPNVPTTEINKLTKPSDYKNAATYTGLNLFSDIPPDDDNLSVNNVKSKRLQGVFYDDFDETIEALNSNEIPKTNLNSIFNNKSPLINKDTTISCKGNAQNEAPKLKNFETSPESENVNILSKEKTNADLSTKRSVSKLLMPNININVQALLPGSNCTSLKHKEDRPKQNEANNDKSISPLAVNTFDSVSRHELVSDLPEETTIFFRTAETEHILPNVTKNRVKAPATRRPSTRRARQENYRKSLIEEQKIAESEDMINEWHNETVSIDINERLLNDDSKISKLSIPSVKSSSTMPNSAIFLTKTESNDENKEIPNTKSENAQSKSSQIFIDEEIKKNSNCSNPVKTADKKESFAIKTLIFEDESGDDLFNNIKSAKSAKREDRFEPNPQKIVPEKISPQISKKTTEIHNITNIDVTKKVPLASIVVDKGDYQTNIHDVNKNESTKQKANSCQVTGVPSDTAVIEKKTDLLNQASTSMLNKTMPSFFDDEDNIVHDLFKPTNARSFNQAKQDQAKSQFKSFLDSESEEENNVTGLQIAPSSNSATLSDKIETKYRSNVTKTDKSKKLFSDSDTDSDDLFGKLRTSTTKTSNVAKPSTESTTKSTKISPKPSLFCDESDDDDDFFKTSDKRSEPENKTKVAVQGNTSLFSDIDSDEDDLFGSNTAAKPKAIATDISYIKTNTTLRPTVNEVAKPTISKPTKPTTTTVADNPLADLL